MKHALEFVLRLKYEDGRAYDKVAESTGLHECGPECGFCKLYEDKELYGLLQLTAALAISICACDRSSSEEILCRILGYLHKKGFFGADSFTVRFVDENELLTTGGPPDDSTIN